MTRHATFAVALLALFISLGGASEAARLVGAGDIKKNAIRSKHIKNNSLTGADIKESSLKISGLKGDPGPAGPQGAQGAQGAKGDAGASAADLFAVVDAAHDGVVRGRGVSSFSGGAPDNGRVDILFNRNLEGCAAVAGVAAPGPPAPGAPVGGAFVEELSGTALRVVTYNAASGLAEERPFHVLVFC